jgi:polysaccharide export outer membrane protein
MAMPQSTRSEPAGTPAQTAVTPNASEDFIIGPEDVLEIKVWREPDLTTKGVVRPDGKIGVTLLGDVQASGLTTTQLKGEITAKLTRFVGEPEVSVVVVEIHSQMVHLIGAVGRPGAYTLGGPLTVVELLARAGGLSEFTKGENIFIVRNATERILFNYKAFSEGRGLQQNIRLKNGDVVIVR